MFKDISKTYQVWWHMPVILTFDIGEAEEGGVEPEAMLGHRARSCLNFLPLNCFSPPKKNVPSEKLQWKQRQQQLPLPF